MFSKPYILKVSFCLLLGVIKDLNKKYLQYKMQKTWLENDQ